MTEQEAVTKPVPLIYKDLRYINVKDIIRNVRNPREAITRKEVTDIKESILSVGGILVPIVVYEENGKYVLLDGERRWRAAKELAHKDPRFELIPANILERPPTSFDNLRTMFNIHRKRRDWSTAATAEALGKLIKFGAAQKLTSAQLSNLTGLDSSQVRDLRLFLKMPADLRERCLDGELNEYYLIFLGRNFEALEKSFPKLFKRYTWEDLARRYIAKVDKKWVRRTWDFNKLVKIAQICIENESDDLFIEVFNRLAEEESFTPSAAEKHIHQELGYKLDSAFRSSCKDFLRSLKSYFQDRKQTGLPISKETTGLLSKILEEISNFLKPKNQG